MTSYTQQFADELSPDTARRVLTDIGRTCVLVVIIDEFDKVESDDARQAMADTLKFLSDKNVPATIVLIGVSDDVEELISQHESTERCLVQVRMPRMSEAEISSIVVTCLKLASMGISREALTSISYMSKGLPHYAHLLGLHSGRQALNQGEKFVSKEHVTTGIHSAIEKVNASVQALYRDAISSSQKDAQYKEVLLACALAPTDEFGFFAPVDVRGPLSRINGVATKIEAFARHLHAFSEDERGPVLKRTTLGKRRPRFRFINPLLQPYVLLKGIDNGLISDDDLRNATTRGDDPPEGMLF